MIRSIERFGEKMHADEINVCVVNFHRESKVWERFTRVVKTKVGACRRLAYLCSLLWFLVSGFWPLASSIHDSVLHLAGHCS